VITVPGTILLHVTTAGVALVVVHTGAADPVGLMIGVPGVTFP
jgi:hypothetical protein